MSYQIEKTVGKKNLVAKTPLAFLSEKKFARGSPRAKKVDRYGSTGAVNKHNTKALQTVWVFQLVPLEVL